MTRASADIGAGLRPARPARRIGAGERIHVVGAAGAGASAAALLAHWAGASVTCCDGGVPSPYSAALARAGLGIEWQHDPSHVAGPEGGGALVDRLAVTKALTSIDPHHPELAAARRLDVPAEPWQQVIADAAATHGGRLVAVAGTHGKSTATGWLVHVLVRAGREPGAFVGALFGMQEDEPPSTARWGAGGVFVVEADEYAGNFDPYRAELAVLLNAEWDHPDVFADEDAVIEAFRAWVAGSGAERRTLIANVADPGVAKVVARLGVWTGSFVAVALTGGSGAAPDETPEHRRADVIGHLDDDGALRIDLPGPPADRPITARLALAGRHNAANAVAVAAAAWRLGVDRAAIADGLASFRGVGRRLELKGEPNGIAVLDDYGHHPTAIAATIDAVRQLYPGRRLWAVYEPLTFHRTAAMLDRFADVLAHADESVVADIWPGRDPDTSITNAAALAGAIRDRGRTTAVASGSVEATADHLARRVERGDVVLVMGGGRSYVIADRLVELLSAPGWGSVAGHAELPRRRDRPLG